MPEMRPGSRSRTSDWVAALRALYSEAPPDLAVLDDAVAERLLPRTLAQSVRIASRLPFGPRVAHRLIGSVTFGLSYGVPLRTAAIDDAVCAAIEGGARQLVLLGAGLDARAWRMPELGEVTVFELDHPDTQEHKKKGTADLPPLARDVRFCAIDFERERIPDALAQHGFDPSQSSMWVWEGVTMYLTTEAIDATLGAVEQLSATGSRLAVTYLPPKYGPAWMRWVGSTGAALIGEHLRATPDPEEIGLRLGRHGFQVESDDSALEWAGRWPPADAKRVRPFERLAVAVRVPKP